MTNLCSESLLFPPDNIFVPDRSLGIPQRAVHWNPAFQVATNELRFGDDPAADRYFVWPLHAQHLTELFRPYNVRPPSPADLLKALKASEVRSTHGLSISRANAYTFIFEAPTLAAQQQFTESLCSPSNLRNYTVEWTVKTGDNVERKVLIASPVFAVDIRTPIDHLRFLEMVVQDRAGSLPAMFHSTLNFQHLTRSDLPEGHCDKLKELTLVGCPSRCSMMFFMVTSDPEVSLHPLEKKVMGRDRTGRAHSLTEIRFLTYPEPHRAMFCAYCRRYGHHRDACDKKVAADARKGTAGGHAPTAAPASSSAAPSAAPSASSLAAAIPGPNVPPTDVPSAPVPRSHPSPRTPRGKGNRNASRGPTFQPPPPAAPSRPITRSTSYLDAAKGAKDANRPPNPPQTNQAPPPTAPAPPRPTASAPSTSPNAAPAAATPVLQSAPRASVDASVDAPPTTAPRNAEADTPSSRRFVTPARRSLTLSLDELAGHVSALQGAAAAAAAVSPDVGATPSKRATSPDQRQVGFSDDVSFISPSKRPRFQKLPPPDAAANTPGASSHPFRFTDPPPGSIDGSLPPSSLRAVDTSQTPSHGPQPSETPSPTGPAQGLDGKSL